MTGQAQQLNAEAPTGMEQLRQLTKAMTRPLIAPDGGAAAEQPKLSFRALLRQLWTQARLTQEELAEALDLTGPEREMFVAAARGRASAAEVLAARGSAAPAAFAAAATRRLQRDFADSTGHYAELEHLLRALTRAVADGVVVVVIHPGSDTRDTCRSITPARQSRQREIVLAELTKQAPPDAPEE